MWKCPWLLVPRYLHPATAARTKNEGNTEGVRYLHDLAAMAAGGCSWAGRCRIVAAIAVMLSQLFTTWLLPLFWQAEDVEPLRVLAEEHNLPKVGVKERPAGGQQPPNQRVAR